MVSVETCPLCGHRFGGVGAVSLPTCPNCGAHKRSLEIEQTAYPYASPPTKSVGSPSLGLSQQALFQMSAETKVASPALVLKVWGGFWLFLAMGLIALSIAAATTGRPGDDSREAMFVFGTLGVLHLACGSMLLAGGICLGRLRAYGFVVAAIIFGMVSGFFLCLPFCLLGIWPLTIVFDPQVKQAFILSQT